MSGTAFARLHFFFPSFTSQRDGLCSSKCDNENHWSNSTRPCPGWEVRPCMPKLNPHDCGRPVLFSSGFSDLPRYDDKVIYFGNHAAGHTIGVPAYAFYASRPAVPMPGFGCESNMHNEGKVFAPLCYLCLELCSRWLWAHSGYSPRSRLLSIHLLSIPHPMMMSIAPTASQLL